MDLLLLLIVGGTLAFAGWLIYLGTKSKEFKNAVEDIKEEIDDIEEFIESIPTIAELKKMTKTKLEELGRAHGIELDKRKTKANMIVDLEVEMDSKKKK